ncbi:MAG: PIG-L family deacetylase [Chitinophagaceae bacterium]|nr:PIG-L family deacetylase [Chitinophagaceae bacterium]
MKKILLLVVIIVSVLAANAQNPQTLSSSEILLKLRKLNVLGSVLYIAAHPDDENTRLLAYLANEKLYRTGYLSLTRGDGGQNLIGDEQGTELGLIRTQELLAARRTDGAEQFFTRAYDFGFSKSSDEAMRIWGHDKILGDVVWIIRKFKPDVIITRFPEDARAGHGHHTASAILAHEAFEAASNPSMFPEQLKQGVTAWKAKRLLWNTFSFGNTNTTSDDQFKIDVGLFNPLLGKGYGEIAALSRSQHKSQGFGVAAQRGSSLEYFVTVKGDTPKKELLEGVDESWRRSMEPEGTRIQAMLDSITRGYSYLFPEKSVPALLRLYGRVKKLKDEYWKEQKLKEIRNTIEYCSGLFIDATVDKQYPVQGDSLKIGVTLNNRSGVNWSSAAVKLNETYLSFGNDLPKNKNITETVSLFLDPAKPLMQPYWLKDPMEKGSFTVTDQQLIGMAENIAPSVDFILKMDGEVLTFTKPIRYRYTDPVKGELYQPMVIVPQNTPREKELNVQIQLNPLNETGKPVNKSLSSAGPVTASNSRLVLRSISYDHIPAINYIRTDSVKQVVLDLKITGKKIGYIEGAGDKVVGGLQQMGYDVSVLSDKDLQVADLSQFQAIITGVRAYNVRESLNNYHEKLMKYIEQGGNLIVQYNTSSQLGPVKAKIGPYPFNISRVRITDETAPVKLLKKDHPLLNYPNKITDRDFEGWVQERSIYHAQSWDNHYETILSMHDPGESDEEGSVILAKYGKGHFVYTGLVFFRELPAGVAGSFRLLANLISLQ